MGDFEKASYTLHRAQTEGGAKMRRCNVVGGEDS